MICKSLKSTPVALLLCLVLTVSVAAATLNDHRSRRSFNPALLEDDGMVGPDVGQGQYVDGNLLDTILSRPSKRQWCRRGMTYNHVLGTCTLSFAAMRGRARGY